MWRFLRSRPLQHSRLTQPLRRRWKSDKIDESLTPEQYMKRYRTSGPKPQPKPAAAVKDLPYAVDFKFWHRIMFLVGGSLLVYSVVPHPHISRAVADDLKELLGDERFTFDEDVRMQHGKETHGYRVAVPNAVCWPETTEEVVRIVQVCNKHHVPLVPWAAGTSVEAHILPGEGGSICMDLSMMSDVITVNQADMDAVVQPGVTWNALNEHVKPMGLMFTPDPAPGAMIGGMVGTNAAGTNCAKYGSMKDNVVNLKVVMADGSVMRTAQRAKKTSAGYDLTRLIVGSEGTLGIVTEATVRLRRIPDKTAVARVPFPSVEHAANATINIMEQDLGLQCVEMCDDTMMADINKMTGSSFPETTTMFFKFAGSEPQVARQVECVREACVAQQGGEFSFADSEAEAERMWQARKVALWAATVDYPNMQPMTTDVAVPISRFAEIVTATKKDISTSPLHAPIVAHAGDGNFHAVIMFDPDDPDDIAEAERLNKNMVKRAIEMDGTCTGEHGVGIGKMKYLKPELGEEALEVMRKIKRALDPENILNPGKVVSWQSPHCSMEATAPVEQPTQSPSSSSQPEPVPAPGKVPAPSS